MQGSYLMHFTYFFFTLVILGIGYFDSHNLKKNLEYNCSDTEAIVVFSVIHLVCYLAMTTEMYFMNGLEKSGMCSAWAKILIFSTIPIYQGAIFYYSSKDFSKTWIKTPSF